MEKNLAAFASVVMIFATAGLGWHSMTGRTAPVTTGTSVKIHKDLKDNGLPARLWEDPLQANEDLPTGYEPPSVAQLSEQIRGRLREGICFLVLPVPDDPFPDDHENRLRMRYSLQMAMAGHGYHPEKRNYINVTSVDSACKTKASGQMPFEWFVRNGTASKGEKSRCRYSLVFWVPGSLFNRELIHKISNLQVSPYPYYSDAPCALPVDTQKIIPLYIIGPRSSDTLIKLLQSKVDSLSVPFEIFSPYATTADALLEMEAFTEKDECKKLKPRPIWQQARHNLIEKLSHGPHLGMKPAGAAQRKFHNFIALDDQLTDLLVDELELRGIKFSAEDGANQDKILLLAEADTSHGRALPLSLQASILAKTKEAEKTRIALAKRGEVGSDTPKLLYKEKHHEVHHPQLLVYRYLRGLDQQKGSEGNAASKVSQPAKTAEEALTRLLTKESARPYGESQLDYVDRLVDEIQQARDIGGIKAVGILGGDIYDKLILLRSLRPRFPGAIFFTTDLDARLWHHDYLSFTRNLIVASAYNISRDKNYSHRGLYPLPKITKDSEGRVAPYRDVYQVAAFEACKAALHRADDREKMVVLTAPPPQIYELGLKGPHELRTSRIEESGEERSRAKKIEWKNWVGSLLMIIGGIAMLITIFWMARRKDYEDRSPSWRAFLDSPRIPPAVPSLLTLAGVVALFVWMWYVGHSADSEPWAWNEGISSWPTETMRACILGAAIVILFWLEKRFIKWERIQRKFCLRPPQSEMSDSVASPAPVIGRWTRLIQWVKEADLAPGWPQRDRKQGCLYAVDVFATFHKYGTPRRRWTRVILATLAYGFIGGGLMYLIDGGPVPRPNIRGDEARMIDVGLLVLSVTAFLVLLFYVLDAVVLLTALLKSISGEDTQWPPALLDRFSKSKGVSGPELAGYLDVQFAAQTSQMTGRMIFLPFVLLFFMILSRTSYFDRWCMPTSLLLIFLCNIILAILAWLMMRRTVKKLWIQAHDKLEDALREKAIVINNTKPGTNQVALKNEQMRLEWLVKDIEGERRGAFSSFFQDPALNAMLLPTGAFGLLAIIFRVLFGASL